MIRACALVEAGDAPGRNPLLGPLGRALRDRAVELLVFDVSRPWRPEMIPAADIYLLKGDDAGVCAVGGYAADRGARCLNSVEATLRVADKARVHLLLDTAHLPVPDTSVAGDAAAVGELLARADIPKVVKPLRGAHGVGVAIWHPGDAAPMPGPGPWLVQDLVGGDGFDVKVYGVGDRYAVRRTRFHPGRADGHREVVDQPDPRVGEIARAAARVCGLRCWGVDLLINPGGPVIVDVNSFPGYRTVPEAANWVATAVVDVLDQPYGMTVGGAGRHT
ncbi:ATP-grasp domain-containing protein [Actinokineospora sp.]|uniref:ATP-grasp domain-containing protein n=1 Tax=Actinokineospora sp. TaxID=1872133 RepID=UPI003D6A7F6D